MKNSIVENLTDLNTDELVLIEAGSFFFDLGIAFGHYAHNLLDDIASGKLVATHSGMGAYSAHR